MSHRSLVLLGVLAGVVAIVTLAPVSVTAQSQAENWSPPRTAWGAPDVQGVWDFRTLTPLERPVELGEKEVYTAEEVAEFEATRLAEFAVRDDQEPADVVGNYNQFWFDPGTTAVETKRTSLVVDPSDGRVPPLTAAAAEKKAALDMERRGLLMHDVTHGGWVEELGPGGLQVRCLVGFNSGPPMTPGGYNQNVQLFQTADYVVLLAEMVHNARIVPLDGRAHIDHGVRQWTGDSRGHWDGDTLVVETTNFLRETGFRRGASSTNLRLVERFTRVSPETLMYEATVEDPTVWSRPWTYQIPMAKSDYPMYEYACHEGNYGLYNMLAGAREAERAEEQAGAR